MANRENLHPSVIRRISREISELSLSPLEGITIDIKEEDVTDIRASITGPEDTPYVGGVFRVNLKLGRNFPVEPPKGFFLTKIFHPNVASNGEICVNVLKRDWKPELGIRHVLLTVKCLLINPNPESALNEEAGKLLLENYNDYCSRAKIFTEIHAKPRGLHHNSSLTTTSSTQNQDPAVKDYGANSTDGPSLNKRPAVGPNVLAQRSKNQVITARSKKNLKRL